MTRTFALKDAVPTQWKETLKARSAHLRRLAGLGDKVDFHNPGYLRHNARRQEHLASLGLPIAGRSVLEVGAGIGDHTSFFVDRGCRVTATDARPQNVLALAQRYPQCEVRPLDLDRPALAGAGPFDIVYCYGTLYHLEAPQPALRFLAAHCRDLLLLETSVSFGEDERLNPVRENAGVASQSFHGQGCRPTRLWVWARLKESFAHVYVPRTQPRHEQFPLDWTVVPDGAPPPRAIFIAARSALDNRLLSETLLARQDPQP